MIDDPKFLAAQAGAWTEVRKQFEGWTQTPNGPGSYRENTAAVSQWLPAIIELYDIHSMLDVPCGDLNWMRHVDLEGLERYYGWDVEPKLISDNEIQFGNDSHDVMFDRINILEPRYEDDWPPDLDLIWCRDLTIHLPIAANQAMLDNFRRSGATYLAITNCPTVEDNVFDYPPEGHDNRPGYWCHPINLELPPFNLGTGILSRIPDCEGREMILVEL